MRFSSKVVLVTGGASGIGEAACCQFAAEGAVVFVADISDLAGEKVATQLGGGARFVHLDVANDVAWQKTIDHILATAGRLDIMVNCAAVSVNGSIEDTSLEMWQRTLSVNLTGTFLACQHAVRAMRKSGGGSIVNLGSANSVRARADGVPYCSSKAAIIQLTRCVALHCGKARYNIRCNAVMPGAIDTPMLYGGMTHLKDRAELEELMGKLHPIGRMGQPSEVAELILFLASDQASFVTASAFAVDGGLIEA